MPKTDLKKELKHLYTASAKSVALVDVPKLKFLMIDGSGDPNTNPLFQQAMEALFSVAYTLKFTLKRGPEKLDWSMMAVEGLWWTEGAEYLDTADKASWKWTLMMTLPDFVTAAMVRQAKTAVKEKKSLARVDDIRLEAFREGPCIQILHIGPYTEEGPALEKLRQFAAESGYALTGKHHEIYFSDPRRVKPEKWRTLLRLPVRKAG